MTIFKQELRSQRLAVLIWGLSIAFMDFICILMFPQMKAEMGQVNMIFASMGAFTKAFGMDRLNFGTMLGFYAIECGNMLGIGGAFFAAITGVTSLMKEERDRTAEFLLTHPVSRKKVVTEKLLSVAALILILNAIVVLVALAALSCMGESVPMKEFWLLHLAMLLMQFEIAGISFGISAFLSRSGIGIGIGIAGIMYALNLIANIATQAKPLKYISAFGYTEASDLFETGKINEKYLIPGMILMAAGIVTAYIKYTKKDIK